MNTQTVSPATARLLADAGFPQPAPAPGQWWGNGEKLVFVFRKWLDVKFEYIGVIERLETAHPGVNRYYDNEDFTSLVYLPTVGDILRALGAWKYLHLRDSVFMVSRESHLGILSHRTKHESEHEAAALAWLELNKK